MNDTAIDRLVRDADPAPRAELAALDLRDAADALLEEIMSTPETEQIGRRRRSLRSRLVTGVAAAAVITAAAGVPAWLAERDGAGAPQAIGGDGSTGIYSAAAVRVAERNPRLLIDEPGWVATTVYGFTHDRGTIEFSRDGRALEMNWYPADAYDAYRRDRLDVSRPERVTVDGHAGDLYTYAKNDFAVMLAPDGGSFVELRTSARGWTDRADFLAVLSHVRKASVEEWLAALPDEIVKPDGARDAVEAMLADMPEPPGFELAPLLELGPSDRYQLGAAVSRAVSCGWFAAWERAVAAGDDGARERAVAALATSRSWSILREMDARGDYPEAVWQLADQVVAGDAPATVAEMSDCHG